MLVLEEPNDARFLREIVGVISYVCFGPWNHPAFCHLTAVTTLGKTGQNKVTESELQKLLIHKVQNLFDPLSDPHAGDLQRGSNLLKEKPTAEGQHLSAYIVTVLSRIMVDFSRFADLVLRWQLNATDRKCDRKAGPKRPATAHVTFDTGSAHSDVSNPSIDWELHCQPILERLERLDQQNTELEGRHGQGSKLT